MEMERRFTTGATVEGRQLIGLAAPFGAETRIADFTEVIAPGAFTRTLSENRDILALVDHDSGKVLGRTRSGTLELRETPDGLAYRVTLPDTTTGNDLRALAQRGDLGGVSMGFVTIRDSWDGERRTLHEVELHEVSIVQAHAAYPTTTVSLRSRQPVDQLAVMKFWLETVK